MTELSVMTYQSPIGEMELVMHGSDLVYLDFSGNPERFRRLLSARFGDFTIRPGGKTSAIHDALDRYFRDGGNPFAGIPMQTYGTPFQKLVWRALQEIPPGTTIDYSELARRVGNPRAVRAAGTSNARNPISVIIPCHRVIGRDGTLRGYAGGEDRKRWLIEHEAASAARRAA